MGNSMNSSFLRSAFYQKKKKKGLPFSGYPCKQLLHHAWSLRLLSWELGPCEGVVPSFKLLLLFSIIHFLYSIPVCMVARYEKSSLGDLQELQMLVASSKFRNTQGPVAFQDSIFWKFWDSTAVQKSNVSPSEILDYMQPNKNIKIQQEELSSEILPIKRGNLVMHSRFSVELT